MAEASVYVGKLRINEQRFHNHRHETARRRALGHCAEDVDLNGNVAPGDSRFTLPTLRARVRRAEQGNR